MGTQEGENRRKQICSLASVFAQSAQSRKAVQPPLPQTWLKVAMLAPQARSPQRVPPGFNPAFASVHDWSLGHRFEHMLWDVPFHMSYELSNQFRLVTPRNGVILLAASLARISHRKLAKSRPMWHN